MRPSALLLLMLASIAGLAGPAAAQPLQRMLLAASGCYDLRPGAATEVPAYCLDQERRAPPYRALLTKAPAPLGDAIVRSGDETLALEAAIASGWLHIEGMGEFSVLRLRNVSPQALTVCIRQPTVVMAVDGSTVELAELYDRIKALASQRPDATDAASRKAVQEALWRLMRRPGQTRATSSGEVDGSRRGDERRDPSPRKAQCSGDGAGSIVACVER
jgi:hypothetical protein